MPQTVLWNSSDGFALLKVSAQIAAIRKLIDAV